MYQRSDVRERLPRFQTAMESVSAVAQAGGFEGVSSRVLRYIKGAVPVGVNGDGEIILPRFYKAENGPPVLMLQDDEEKYDFRLSGRRADRRLAESLIYTSGHKATVSKAILDTTVETSTNHAYVNHSIVHIMPHGEAEAYDILVPRVMVVGNRQLFSDQSLGPYLAHEADHWDYFLNTASRFQGDTTHRLSPAGQMAVSEKRGYALSHTIETNLGYYAGLRTLDMLAEEFVDLAPTDVGYLRDSLGGEYEAARKADVLSISMLPLIIERLFGRPDQAVTDEELVALRTVGIITYP